jgi:hypothetical protein
MIRAVNQAPRNRGMLFFGLLSTSSRAFVDFDVADFRLVAGREAAPASPPCPRFGLGLVHNLPFPAAVPGPGSVSFAFAPLAG